MTDNHRKCLFILLNWNGTEDTLACCESLAQDNELYDVLIIDNASDEMKYNMLFEGMHNIAYEIKDVQPDVNGLLGRYEIEVVIFFKNRNKNFTLIRSSVNHGFAKGCNLGTLYAAEKNYEYILFLNNDTVVESNFFPIMKKTLEKCDAVIPQIRYYHDKNLIWNCGGNITKYGKRIYFFANKKINDVQIEDKDFLISFATGCALMFRTHFFIKLGLFSEKFFFGEEDVDLALRMKAARAKILCSPKAVIYHKVGASLAGDNDRAINKSYIHYLNRFVNMKLHLGIEWWLWIFPSIIKVMINNKKISKLKLKSNIIFTMNLLFDAINLNSVDKAKFQTVIKKGYPSA
ncbi:glycosyltransferase [Candidatus Erwinia dacicola]|uniref:Glycosyltransferase 2-like domain-containing protein n=2 Tax=Candidatus Erwinia dacicola TaxID=252393 RepID=A0A1E7YVT7_9GAMM|nr:glycosyltransferase family 2 protein [Candidatus Erwinia dacicola]NJD00909.1 glycosyltransferase family 2 protein [Candidatus Erwinia dacicola]NJD85657.1 glycosyltransferase family 2 protein [Candidatus Erwinia dacicola]OFC60038.1 hypothetical protein BBW68_14965 [Candidatus Erwinia dacicola]